MATLNTLLYNPVPLVSFYKRDFRSQEPNGVFRINPRMNIELMTGSSDPNVNLQEIVQYSQNGLHIEFTRPLEDSQGNPPFGIVGVFAVLPLWSEALRKIPYFVLVARFRNPELKLNPSNSLVTFASGVAMKAENTITNESKLYGATSKFEYNRPNSSSNFNSSDIVQRLNILGIPSSKNIELHQSESASLIDTSEIFTVAFVISRHFFVYDIYQLSVFHLIDMKAGLHINPGGSQSTTNYVTEFGYHNLAPGTEIADVRVGLGTISPETYRVSVDILDFEVFVKPEFIKENPEDYNIAQGYPIFPGIEILLRKDGK